MQLRQQAALAEVLRINARLSAEMSAKKPDLIRIEELRLELGPARAILAVERGLAELVKRGGPEQLSQRETQAVIQHLIERAPKCDA